MKQLSFYTVIKNLLSIELKRSLIYLYLILLLVSLFELLSLATVPALISFLVSGNYNFFNSSINFFESKNIVQSSLLITLIIIIIFSFKSLFMIFANYYEIHVLKRARVYITNNLIKKYLNNKYVFFVENSTSFMSRNLITESNNCISYIQSIITLFKEILLLLVVFFLVTIYQPILSIITLSLFVLFALIFYLSTDKLLKKNAKVRILSSELVFKLINQSLTFIKDIKVFNKENFFLNNFYKSKELFENKLAFAQLIARLPRIFFEYFGVLLLVILLYYSTIHDPRNNLIDLLPFLALLTVAVIKLMPSFNGISGALTHLASFKNSFFLIENEINNNENNSEDYFGKLIKSSKNEDNNAIIIKDLNFSYKKNNVSLNNLSLKIKENNISGIIGRSGAGKSTLINLILGLLEIKNGSIQIFSKKKSTKTEKIISYVPQDILILDDKISNNIAFGIEESEIDKERVEQVINMSGLRNFMNKNNYNLNTKLGERGINISGGEKQRIGIARSLYFRPEILILDESTSSLDNETEVEILNEIFKFKKNMTIIIIAHRLNTLKFCDTVFYLEKGKLKDNDKIENLINKYPDLSKEKNFQNEYKKKITQ